MDLEGTLIHATAKKYLRLVGTVKWYNIKKEYNLINCDDTNVHHTAMMGRNPQKTRRWSAGEGETVEFDIMERNQAMEAAN